MKGEVFYWWLSDWEYKKYRIVDQVLPDNNFFIPAGTLTYKFNVIAGEYPEQPEAIYNKFNNLIKWIAAKIKDFLAMTSVNYQ